MVHRRRRSGVGALKAVVAALEAQRRPAAVNRWSQRPVARAAVELGRERALAALVRQEPYAERPEAQPEREAQAEVQLEAQPQEAAHRHSVHSLPVPPGPKPDAAEPLEGVGAVARVAAGPPRDAAQERLKA